MHVNLWKRADIQNAWRALHGHMIQDIFFPH